MTGRRIGWRIGAGVVLALLAAGCAKAEASASRSNLPQAMAQCRRGDCYVALARFSQ